MMGSGAEAARETVERLAAQGEKVGVLKVRLYRPFSAAHSSRPCPKTAAARSPCWTARRRPGAAGEPLYLDVVAALRGSCSRRRRSMPRVIGGRYGLSSKEFTPAMAKAVFDELASREAAASTSPSASTTT